MSTTTDAPHTAYLRQVHAYDLTLLLPFELRIDKGREDAQKVTADALKCEQWERLTNRLIRGASEEEYGYAFAEMAYFHPFIRELTYGTPQEKGHFEIYRHKAPGTVNATGKNWTAHLRLSELRLYCASDGTMALVLQLSADEPIQWNAALDLISYLRIAYFPHYKLQEPGNADGQQDGDRYWEGGGALESVCFTAFQNGSTHELTGINRLEELQEGVQSLKPRLLPHWEAILRPLLTSKHANLRLLGDHRMAVMAIFAVPGIARISDDEWFAISEADGASFIPYAPAFRDCALRKAAYDRWWDPRAPRGALKHRYLTGSLVFASVIGIKDPDSLPGYIQRLRGTWQRQMFQIFFIAHMQRARLMMFQNAIAEITRPDMRHSSRKLRQSVEKIEREMAIFSSRLWFVEITPQCQGQELFAKLRKQLASDSLYKGVIEDKALLANWTASMEERERNRFWDRVNHWFLPLGVFLAFLGINFLIEPLRNTVRSWVIPVQDGQTRTTAQELIPDLWLAAAAFGSFAAVLLVWWGIRKWKTR